MYTAQYLDYFCKDTWRKPGERQQASNAAGWNGKQRVLLWPSQPLNWLWWSIVVFSTGLQDISSHPTTVHLCLEFPVASIYDLPGVVNCLFHVFTEAPMKAILFLSPDQQSGIHCQMICVIQLLTPNILCRTWKQSSIHWKRNVSALRVFVLRNLHCESKKTVPLLFLL